MEELSSTVWPPGRRAGVVVIILFHVPPMLSSEGYCYGKDGGCPRMKEGNPFGPFWDHFNINFDTYYNYMLHYETSHDPTNALRWHKQYVIVYDIMTS